MRVSNKLRFRWIPLLLGILSSHGVSDAANCGGATTCNCNDTLTSNYTLPADLLCPYDGSSDLDVLSSNTGSITLNTNGHRISGFNPTWPVQPYTGWPSGITDQEDVCVNWGGVSNAIVSGGGSFDGCKTGVAFQNTNSTVTAVTITNAGQIGININATGEVVSSNTITGVFGYGIRDVANGAIISSNTLSGNYTDVQINTGYSIQFSGISTGFIVGNNIHDNAGYAFGTAPVGVIFSSNTISNQKAGLFPSAVPDLGFDGTNTLDGYPIKIVAGAPGATYDGNTTGNYGYFSCTTCSGVTLQNMPAIEQVYLSASPNFIINNIAIADYTADTNAIRFDATSTGGLIEHSSFTRIGSSGQWIIAVTTNNTTVNDISCMSSVSSCVGVQSAVTGTSVNNIRSFNGSGADIFDTGTGTTITNSSFYFPKANSGQMITWNEATRTGTIGTPISYSFNMTDAHGQGVACPSCSYAIASYPPETVSSSAVSNVVSGSFTPSKNGIYSLLVTVQDGSGNKEVKNFAYLIGPTSSQTTRYYYRFGRSGLIVNGLGMDGQPLSLTAPVTDEYAGYCSGWVQDSPVDIPPYPISRLSSVASSVYYTTTAGTTTVGAERFAAYENGLDIGTTVYTPGPYVFTTSASIISGMNWIMDSPGAWNGIAMKLVNTPNPRFPTIKSLAASPSYADFTYVYASTAPVKSISNLLVPLLSGTTAGVTLDNPMGSTASQTIVVGGFTPNAIYTILQDGVTQYRALSDIGGFLTESVSIPPGIHTLTTTTIGVNSIISGQSKFSGSAVIQ